MKQVRTFNNKVWGVRKALWAKGWETVNIEWGYQNYATLTIKPRENFKNVVAFESLH